MDKKQYYIVSGDALPEVKIPRREGLEKTEYYQYNQN